MKYLRSHVALFGFSAAAIILIAVCVFSAHTYFLRFSDGNILTQCSHLPVSTKALCYTNHINDVLDYRGLKSALNLVATSYGADPDVASFCHSNMHDLGAAAYKQFARTGTIDLSPSASYCGYGFYHGFVTEMMNETGSLKQAVAFCVYVGKTLGAVQQYAEGSCYHGIGHGITDGTDPSTWGDMQKIAAPGLATCEHFAANNEFEARCASGVFNAIDVMYLNPRYKLDVQNDPYALCRTPSYDANETISCYQQMNVIVHFIAHRDMARMLAYAEAIPYPSFRHMAIKSNANLVYASPPNPTYSEAISNCNALVSDDRNYCLIGLIDSFMEFGTPGGEYVRALSFCGLPQLSQEQTAACFREVVIYAKGIYPAKLQQEICALVPPAFTPAMCAKNAATAKKIGTPAVQKTGA